MLKMNGVLLIFILKVLTLLHGAPIDVVDHKDNLTAETVILENPLHKEFVVTENANNLVKAIVDFKEEARSENNSMTAPTTIESFNGKITESSQDLNVNETFTGAANKEEKSAESLKLNTELNQTLETLDSAFSQSLDIFKEGLKSVQYMGSSKTLENSQNSDNMDSTTILVRVYETPEQFLEHRTEVTPSDDNFTEGLKSFKNFGFNDNSKDLQKSNINETVATAKETSENLDQNQEDSTELKTLETINLAVKHSAESYNEGLASLENLSLHQSLADSQNPNENVEATTSAIFDQTADGSTDEESTKTKTLETITSAVKESVNYFNKGLKSLENFTFQKNLADSENSNINENVEVTTLVNFDQTPKEGEESKPLETTNSAEEQSFNVLNENLKSFHQSLADSQNRNTNENVEAATLVNFDQTLGESEESKPLQTISSAVKQSFNALNEDLKSLDNLSFHHSSAESQNFNINKTINSAVDKSADSLNKGLKTLENLDFHKNSLDSQNSNTDENVEATTLLNFDKIAEESTVPQTSETVNSALGSSVDTLTEGFKTLQNFSFNKNSQDLENSNINENVDITTKVLINLDKTPEEISESNQTFDSISAAVKQSGNTVTDDLKHLEKFSLYKNSEDPQNSNIGENIETITTTLTNQTAAVNLESHPPAEDLDSKHTLGTLKSAVQQSGNSFNEGLKYLNDFSFHQNSDDSHNSNINENVETATTTFGNFDQTLEKNSKSEHTLGTITSAVQQSANSINEAQNALKNLNINKSSAVSQDFNIKETGEMTATNYANVEQNPIESLQSKTFETINSTAEQSIDTLNRGLKAFNENSENSQNSYNNENVKTTASATNAEDIYKESLDSKALDDINSAAKQSVDTTLENFNFNKSTKDSQNLNNNVEEINKGRSELKSLLNPIQETLNSAGSESVDKFNKELKNFENLSLNKNSEESQNSHGNYHIIEDSIMVDQTTKHSRTSELNTDFKQASDSLNSALNHSTVIFNEGVEALENFKNLENTTTDSKPSTEDVEVAKIEEIFITTQTPNKNLFDKINQIPANLNEYLRKESEQPQQHFEQNSENNSEVRQLLSTTSREEETKLYESHQEIVEGVTDTTTAQKETNIGNIFSTTESVLVNLREIADQASQESLDQKLALNSAVDLLTNGVILMKNSFDLENPIAKETNSSPEEILMTTEAPGSHEELKYNVEDISNATTEENSSDRESYTENIPAEDTVEKILTINDPLEENSAFKHSENSFLTLEHNNKSETVLEILETENLNEPLNKNPKNSQYSNDDNKEYNEQILKSRENFYPIPEDSQQFKSSRTYAEELSSVNNKEEANKMQPNFMSSQISTENINENFTEIPKDSTRSNVPGNEKVIEPEVGQDIIQIAAKLIEEEDKIIDINQNSETNVSKETNDQIKSSISQTDNENIHLGPEAKNGTTNNVDIEQNYEKISTVKILNNFRNKDSGNRENMQPLDETMTKNLEREHSVESTYKLFTEMPTISLKQLSDFQESSKEVPKEILTTTEEINLSTSQEIGKIYENLAGNKEPQEVEQELSTKFNVPSELPTTETKLDDFTTVAPEKKLKDSLITESNKNNQESDTTIEYNQFTTNPSTNTEETTLNVPSKFEKELNMAVKTLEATTQQHFEQFHQNLQKAFKTFSEWEAEHMKQEENSTTNNMITTTSSLQEDNTRAKTTVQPLTHTEIEESITSMKPLEETLSETSSNRIEEVPNLGVINENFVDKYQENVQENFMKTEDITTMESIKRIEEESSTNSPLMILNSKNENIPQTTMTTNILTTVATLPEQEISSQEELVQLRVSERAAAAEMTTGKNDVNKDHSTAITSDQHETTTTENDGETTIVPLFARVHLQKDINSVSLVKYDNDSIEKESVNTNNASPANSKTNQQHQSNGKYVEQIHETMEKYNNQITTHIPTEGTTHLIERNEEKLTLSTPETFLQDMVTFVQHQDTTTTFKHDDSFSQTQLPLTQAAFMEEQQQQIESTTENNIQTHTSVTGEHNFETEIAKDITTSTTTAVNETITPTTEPDVYSTTIEEAEIETTTETTLVPIQIESEVRSRALTPPKLEYLQNEDGVEVFYGYSIVKRN